MAASSRQTRKGSRSAEPAPGCRPCCPAGGETPCTPHGPTDPQRVSDSPVPTVRRTGAMSQRSQLGIAARQRPQPGRSPCGTVGHPRVGEHVTRSSTVTEGRRFRCSADAVLTRPECAERPDLRVRPIADGLAIVCFPHIDREPATLPGRHRIRPHGGMCQRLDGRLLPIGVGSLLSAFPHHTGGRPRRAAAGRAGVATAR